jgi:hypothetical protein
MNIILVGGGNASLLLLDYFRRIDYIKVKGMVDLNDSAPGIIRARELKIPCFKDINEAMQQAGVDMVIELTGNQKVRQIILEALKPNQHIMSSDAAKIMCDFIEIQGKQRMDMIENLSSEFGKLTDNLKGSGNYIEQSIRNIHSVLLNMEIIVVNAGIEAARAGEHGRAFDVVVEGMRSTLGEIEKALQDITMAAEESKNTMLELTRTEEKLKKSVEVS